MILGIIFECKHACLPLERVPNGARIVLKTQTSLTVETSAEARSSCLHDGAV